MLKLWLEWDFGQDSLIFASVKDAKEWMRRVDVIGTMNGEYDEPENMWDNIEQLFDEGYASLDELVIWNPNEKENTNA